MSNDTTSRETRHDNDFELTLQELETVAAGLCSGGHGSQKYLTYGMSEAIISNYSMSSGGDRPQE
jgi:hypothetical protein